MNKEEKTESLKRILYKSTYLIAYSVSIGACSGLSTGRMIISSIIASLFLLITPETAAFPILIDFLITLFVYNTAGIQGAIFAFTVGIIFMLVTRKSKLITRMMNNDYIRASLTISAAFVMTILMTTIYFGIGSTGNNVIEMIKSYRSLGFHPNWRGILYGTIVMVIVITFPRKFKKAGKIISPEFIAILTAFILNMWLIPKGSVEVITLLEKADYSFITSLTDNIKAVSPLNSIIILLSGISLGLINLMADSELKDVKLRNLAVYNLPSVYTGFIIPGKIRVNKINFIEGVLSALIIAAVALLTKGFERLPLSSCAVVLIVSAWHNVKWGLIPKTFKNIKSAIAFAVITAASILVTPAAGVIAAFASAVIINGDNKNEI